MFHRPRMLGPTFRALAIAATAEAAALLLLRNFYRLLAFDAQFFAIFAQIRDAAMRPPILLPLVLTLAYAAWFARHPRRAAAIAVGCLLWLAVFLSAVALTRVNGVAFIDVLTSLIPLLGAGLEVG